MAHPWSIGRVPLRAATHPRQETRAELNEVSGPDGRRQISPNFLMRVYRRIGVSGMKGSSPVSPSSNSTVSSGPCPGQLSSARRGRNAAAEAAIPTVRSSEDMLTGLELAVIALARRDDLTSFRSQHWLSRWLFGARPRLSLSNPRLEALRRYAVLFRFGARSWCRNGLSFALPTTVDHRSKRSNGGRHPQPAMANHANWRCASSPAVTNGVPQLPFNQRPRATADSNQ